MELLEQRVLALEAELQALQLQHSRALIQDSPVQKAKLKEPSPFNAAKKHDVDRFIQQTENYLKVCGVPPENWAAIAATYFDGDVITWWHTHLEAANHPTYTWEQFTNILRTQYRPHNYREEARRRATSMFQGKWSVYEYAQRFCKEINLVGTMSTDDQIYHFRKGLNPDITKAMLNTEQTTLEGLIQEASLVETRLREIDAMRKGFNPRRLPSTFSNASSGPTPMEIDSIRTQRPSYVAAATSTTSNAIQLRRPGKLTASERKRCEDNKLCFRCRQPGHAASKCTVFPSSPVSSNSKRQ